MSGEGLTSRAYEVSVHPGKEGGCTLISFIFSAPAAEAPRLR